MSEPAVGEVITDEQLGAGAAPAEDFIPDEAVAAPAAPAPRVLAPEVRAAQVQQLADIMSSLDNPDRKAAVLRIARKTGARADFVESQFDFWKGLAEQSTSPEDFYAKNPELAAIALEQPWIGQIVTKDKPLTTLQKALGGFRDLVGFSDLDQWEREAFGKPQFDGPEASWLRTFDPARYVPGDVEGVSPEVKKQTLEVNPAANATGLGRLGIYGTEAYNSFGSVNQGQLAIRYVLAKAAGRDTYELEKQALDSRNTLPQEYSAGPLEEVLLDAAQFAGSDAVSLGATVAGGAAGGPAGAAAASFGTSFLQEMSNLWDFREQVDARGVPVDDQVAVGAAIAYALTAAAVETGVNVGPWAKLIGPLGKAGTKAEVKAFLQTISKDPAKRVLLAKVAEQWGKTALSEGGEEGVQNLLQDAWGWYSRSRSAGMDQGGSFEAQPTDIVGSIGEAIDVAGKATVGAFVGGAAPAARNYYSQRAELRRSMVAERQLAAITGAIQDSPTAKGAPEVFTQMVERETAAAGEPVKAAYVDPEGITRLAQEKNLDPVELVREAVGEAAAERFKEAAATGQKLEVPLQEYVESWGPSGLAEALLPDTTTRSAGVPTPRERQAEQAAVVEETKRLVAEVDSAEDKPTPSEALFTQIGKELAAAGKMKAAQVEPQVKVWRKFVRTEAMKNGLTVDEAAQAFALRVADANKDVAPLQALVAKEQGAAAAPVTPAATVEQTREQAAELKQIREEAKAGGVELDILGADSEKVTLSRIVVPKEQRGTGIGTKVMERLVAWADASGKTLVLTPATDFGASSRQRLVDFYKRFGFVENKGRKKDYSTREDMYRRPTASTHFAGEGSTTGPIGWMETVKLGAKRLVAISLTGKQDLSTFLHESAHAFWELKADLAERPLPPELAHNPEALAAKEKAQADMQAAFEFMGVKDRAELDARAKAASDIRAKAKAEGRALTAEEKARVADLVDPFEKWARGFEAYLMEGKAPSLSLAGAFRTFKLWLTDIYRTVAGLNVQLDASIRGVFDRMLATDQEITEAARQIGIDGPALEAAKSRAEVAALKEVQRATEDWWKKALRREVQDAEEAYAKLPEVVAWRFLRRNLTSGLDGLKALGEDVKLDYGSVVEVVGTDVAEKKFRGLLKKYRSGDEDGPVHPDHLAAALGVDSGRELLEAMVSLPDQKAWAEARAEEAMAARHPGILEERSRLRDLVAAALHDEPAVVEELHKQWEEDRKKAGKKGGVSVEAVRAAARIIVGRQLVQQLDPRRYFLAERDALKRRAKAEAKGDWAAAAKASQERLLNFYLHRESLEAKRLSEQAQELAGKLVSQKGQERLGKASPVYRDFALRLLEAAGLVDGVPPEVRNTGLVELGTEFAKPGVELDPDFDTLAVGALLTNPKAFDDLSVAELGEVVRALTQVRRAARNRTTVLVNGRRVSLDALAGDIRSEASRLPAKAAPEEDAALKEFKRGALWTTGQGFLATITDPLTTYTDDDYLGPTARQALRDRYYERRQVEDELLKLVVVKVDEAFNGMPDDMKSHLYDEVDRSMLPLLPGQRRKGKVSRGWMFQVLANLGNPGNAQRLLEGRGWTMDQVRDFFRVNKLTEEEARFIEGLWKLNDLHLWPRIVKVHEAVNGTKPEKVEAQPLKLQLADGKEIELSGGYWPAMADQKEGELGKRQEDVVSTNEQNYDAMRASLLKGFTKRRAAEAAYPIRLFDFGAYPAHVLQVARYIAFEEFVRDAGRILEAVGPTVEERLGEPAKDQLDRWLQVLASGSPDTVAKAERGFIRALGIFTSRAVKTAMLTNLKNAIADLANPLLSIFGPRNARVRPDYLTGALIEAGGATGVAGAVLGGPLGAAAGAGLSQALGAPFGRGFRAMRRVALEKSPELRSRADGAAQAVRDRFDQFGASGKRWRPFAKLGIMAEPGRLLDFVHHHGFIFQHVAEVWGSTVVWTAAYRQAIGAGVDEKEAVRRADDLIQKTFNSSRPAEKSALLRSKALGGFAAFMHGFFNRSANRMRQTVHPAMVEWAQAEGWVSKERGAAALTAAETGFMALGMLAVLNVLGSLIEGRGPEEGEDELDWVRRKMLASPLVLLPLANEAAPFVELAAADDAVKGRLKFSASERSSPAVSSALRIWKSVGDMADDGKTDSKRFWAAYEVAGFALGLPVSQPKRTGKYLEEWLDDPGMEFDSWKLIYGSAPHQPANLGTVLEGQE